MQCRPRVVNVRLVPARLANGLLGFVSCSVAGLHLDGLTLRKRRDGSLAISFPGRRDRAGRRHYLIRPTSAALETAILAALRRRGDVP